MEKTEQNSNKTTMNEKGKDAETNLHEGHRERLKKKIMLTNDVNVLDHEMLETLLFYIIPVKDTNPLAHRIINTFGSVSAAMDSDVEELMKVRGVGKKTAQYLAILGKFGRAYSRICHQTVAYDLTKKETLNYISDLFYDIDREQVYMLYLNSNKQIVKRFLMFEGSFESVDIDIKDVVKQALMCEAKEVVCVHNHPSNIAKPSYSDKKSSLVMQNAFGLVGINLSDSLIYTESEIYGILSNSTIYLCKNDSFANEQS